MRLNSGPLYALILDESTRSIDEVAGWGIA